MAHAKRWTVPFGRVAGGGDAGIRLTAEFASECDVDFGTTGGAGRWAGKTEGGCLTAEGAAAGAAFI
jgi:hypothetical protein